MLAKRQEENSFLLQEFVRICDKNGLEYWLDFGTLLGAYRHKRAIPWDDDSDVALSLEDYQKFKEIADSEMSEGFTLFEFTKNEVLKLRHQKSETDAYLDIFSYENKGNYLKACPTFTTPSYNRLIPKKFIYPLTKIIYDDIEFNAPNDVESYLRIKYGNFHTLPKKEHDVPDHVNVQEFLIFEDN